MKKIKWGVIGCGGIADRRTIPGMLLCENAECVAVMDKNPESTAKVKEKYNIEHSYTDEYELLARQDIDAIYIATPVFCHKEQVFAAADAGKHILLEKPMGITVKEAKEIADYCSKKGVKLGVGFMMRFHDAHRRIKEEIEKGSIGEIISAYAKFNCWSPVSPIKWRQTKAFSGGGAMMDMGIHCIDLLQYMTSLCATEITAMGGNQVFQYPDTEDAASAVMRMNNGALFTVEANFNIPDFVGCKFEIFGTKGSISAVGSISQVEEGIVTITKNENDVVSASALEYVSGNMYTKEIDGFSKAILENSAVPVTAEQGIFNQQIVEAIYESNENGKHIKLS
ncbi:MAG: Gfo/Idh/MocA family oxidoreductase [Clostridia bacterium]|nr:Gfo/Idh/MocA family oxidoreductase [Clostridia bacterium]